MLEKELLIPRTFSSTVVLYIHLPGYQHKPVKGSLNVFQRLAVAYNINSLSAGGE